MAGRRVIRYYTAAEIREPVERACDNDQDPGDRVNGPGAWPTQGVDVHRIDVVGDRSLSPAIPDGGRRSPASTIFSEWSRENPHLIGYAIAQLRLHRVEALTTEVVRHILGEIEARHGAIEDSAPTIPRPPKRHSGSRTGRIGARDVAEPVVYYMRIGNRVKIGFSTNLIVRLRAINPEELMAVERATPSLEAARHRQFAQYRTHGEWFRLEGELEEFIGKLPAAR